MSNLEEGDGDRQRTKRESPLATSRRVIFAFTRALLAHGGKDTAKRTLHL